MSPQIQQRVTQYTQVGPWARTQQRWRFIPRTKQLQALQGQYTCRVETDHTRGYKAYVASGGSMSFSRWLVKSCGIPDPSAICKSASESAQQFRLTCKYNDILRMSDTRCYDACTSPGRIGAQAVQWAVRCPEFAMLVVDAPSGHFKGRIGFILHNDVVQLFRAYGTMSVELAREFFTQKNIPVQEKHDDLVMYYNTVRVVT